MAEHQEGHANEKVAPEDTGSASDLYTERYTYIYIYKCVLYSTFIQVPGRNKPNGMLDFSPALLGVCTAPLYWLMLSNMTGFSSGLFRAVLHHSGCLVLLNIRVLSHSRAAPLT